jgi:hypothetical protein
MITNLKEDIKMFSLYFTNPAKNMLFGFALQQAVMRDEEGEIVGSTDIFSVGGFFFRLDIFFNEYYEETEE